MPAPENAAIPAAPNFPPPKKILSRAKNYIPFRINNLNLQIFPRNVPSYKQVVQIRRLRTGAALRRILAQGKPMGKLSSIASLRPHGRISLRPC